MAEDRDREVAAKPLVSVLAGLLAGLTLPLGCYLAITVVITLLIDNVAVADMATLLCLFPAFLLGPLLGIIAVTRIVRRSRSGAVVAEVALRVGAVGLAAGLVLPLLLYGLLLLIA